MLWALINIELIYQQMLFVAIGVANIFLLTWDELECVNTTRLSKHFHSRRDEASQHSTRTVNDGVILLCANHLLQ